MNQIEEILVILLRLTQNNIIKWNISYAAETQAFNTKFKDAIFEFRYNTYDHTSFLIVSNSDKSVVWKSKDYNNLNQFRKILETNANEQYMNLETQLQNLLNTVLK